MINYLFLAFILLYSHWPTGHQTTHSFEGFPVWITKKNNHYYMVQWRWGGMYLTERLSKDKLNYILEFACPIDKQEEIK